MNTKTCTAPGCDKPYASKSLCATHYQRMYHYGVLEHGPKTKTCAHCGESYTTTAPQQKYCGPTCRGLAGEASRPTWTLTCRLCGTEYQGKLKTGRHCPDCVGVAISMRQSPENLPIYNAVRNGTAQDVLDAIRGRCTVTGSGCWEWEGHRASSGYGAVSTGRVKGAPQEMTHRVTYEYATGIKPTGVSIHHKCANRACCNPDHLEAATQRDNMAEMFARKAYEARIEALEHALAEHEPNHPLLKETA